MKGMIEGRPRKNTQARREILGKFFWDCLTCGATIHRSRFDNDLKAVLRNPRLTCAYTSLRLDALTLLRHNVITSLRPVVTTSPR
jgi:hypothetical protein